mgnify:CR=1 FL=1
MIKINKSDGYITLLFVTKSFDTGFYMGTVLSSNNPKFKVYHGYLFNSDEDMHTPVDVEQGVKLYIKEKSIAWREQFRKHVDT